MANHHSGRPWERLKHRVFAEETHCWLCGRYVDQDLPPRTRWSRSIDLIHPKSRGGSDQDRSNLRLAHIHCNSSRGNKPPTRTQTKSRHW
jgi:5-methylcytosine-specific restriction endonuclease McrA